MGQLIDQEVSAKNFASLIWHASFLALAQSFLDIDTIVPAMIVEAGGTAIHVGIMATILTGGSSFTQILFAPYISNKEFKKKYLLFGINSRMIALLGVGSLLFLMSESGQAFILPLIFFFITIFAVGGAFANISYMDIVGKTLLKESRKAFFSSKQMVTSAILIVSAFWAKAVLTGSSFPTNYGNAILIGFLALSLASLGFWNIRETIPASLKIKSFGEYLRTMKTELKQNPKLGYFLGFVNTQGLVIGFLPFLILYGKETGDMGPQGTGTLLIFKITGSVMLSLLIFLLNKKIRYQTMMYSNTVLALTLPLLMLIMGPAAPLNLIFLAGGVVFSLYAISMNGVLLEISGDQNRAIYAGFAGAGNILPAVFPLLAGSLIRGAGFNSFFITYMILISISLFYIYKIKCQK